MGTQSPSTHCSITARLSPQHNFLLLCKKGTSCETREDSSNMSGRNLWDTKTYEFNKYLNQPLSTTCEFDKHSNESLKKHVQMRFRNYSIKSRGAYSFLKCLGAALFRGGDYWRRRLLKNLIGSKNDSNNSNIFFLILVHLYTNQQKVKYTFIP